MHFKNLLTGETIQNAISNSSGSVAWANDNRTVFYTSKNDVTLLSEKIWRHKLGSDSKSDEMVYHEKMILLQWSISLKIWRLYHYL